MKRITSIITCLVACMQLASAQTTPRALARIIQRDSSLVTVARMARQVLGEGFNAGSGYSQVWARDLNTFIETALEVNRPADVRGALLVFFAMQQPNGECIDGYVVKKDFTWGDNHPYYSALDDIHVGFKNTVETDQETSLIQAVCKYIRKTGDRSLLQEAVGGVTVLDRMQQMLDYLKRERYSEQYGLIYGAMTADWGDCQPLCDDVVDIHPDSPMAIDVYDNAMLMIALDDLQTVCTDAQRCQAWKQWHDDIAKNVRRHLWDKKRKKFIPHIYLGESPIPAGFDELEVYYHGGTAVAIEAGLLTTREIAQANAKMLENVEKSGMPTIGLTLYPVYPEGFFHGGMSKPYVYQNGGDWTWFGGRMIQQLVRYGFYEEAYNELRPMIDRVIQNSGFYEWYGMGNVPSGSGKFKGSAGVLATAIEMLQDWSKNILYNEKE